MLGTVGSRQRVTHRRQGRWATWSCEAPGGSGQADFARPITLLIANKDIRILAEDGSVLRTLTVDPSRTRCMYPWMAEHIGH